MAALLYRSLQICSGLAVIAGPLFASDPEIPKASKSFDQHARTPIRMTSDEFLPPSPLPESTLLHPVPSPAATLHAPAPASVSSYYYGHSSASAMYGTPGGYEGRLGSPYHHHVPGGGQFVMTGDPYYDHFGPGFHRQSLYGHYRFPYYNYRAPWYYPGRAVYNRDTNFAW